jgi:hypothetical protein
MVPQDGFRAAMLSVASIDALAMGAALPVRN